MFAEFAAALLHGSNKIRWLISNASTVIIIYEFQDTAPNQWFVIQAVGLDSQLLALADPKRRIFDFIGADPERLQHFEDIEFVPSNFDFSDEYHRNKGTDIAYFGNDILKGKFTKCSSDGICLARFEANQNQAITKEVTGNLPARKRLIKNGPKDWYLAIPVLP